nr:hypothetical protein [Bacteroidota bacterium]
MKRTTRQSEVPGREGEIYFYTLWPDYWINATSPIPIPKLSSVLLDFENNLFIPFSYYP